MLRLLFCLEAARVAKCRLCHCDTYETYENDFDLEKAETIRFLPGAEKQLLDLRIIRVKTTKARWGACFVYFY